MLGPRSERFALKFLVGTENGTREREKEAKKDTNIFAFFLFDSDHKKGKKVGKSDVATLYRHVIEKGGKKRPVKNLHRPFFKEFVGV